MKINFKKNYNEWIRYSLVIALFGVTIFILAQAFINLERINELQKKEMVKNHKIEVAQIEKSLAEFDIILSNAVFEHVPAELMDKAFNNMYKYLKKEGVMIHEIDLRDHVNIKGNPFNFYKYSQEKWDKLTKGTIFYTNRLRVSDFDKIFKKNKLKIINIKTKKTNLPKVVNKEFISRYSQKDLEVDFLLLILRK